MLLMLSRLSKLGTWYFWVHDDSISKAYRQARCSNEDVPPVHSAPVQCRQQELAEQLQPHLCTQQTMPGPMWGCCSTLLQFPTPSVLARLVPHKGGSAAPERLHLRGVLPMNSAASRSAQGMARCAAGPFIVRL